MVTLLQLLTATASSRTITTFAKLLPLLLLLLIPWGFYDEDSCC